MNFLRKVLILACLFCVPAQAQQVEIGHGLLCDNAGEVSRFLAVVNGDTAAAIEQVNTEVKNPTACVLIGVAFIRGDPAGEAIHNAEGAWKVTAILVVAVHTPRGWQQIAPHVYFTALKVDEKAA